MNSVILRAAARLLGGIVLLFAVYLLFRGHHFPGGGFIAALVATTGFSIVLLSEGPETVRKGLYIAPQHLIGMGIGLIIAAGGWAVVQGKPFLTGIWWPAQAPWLGTPLLFDTGVFLAVLGAILTVLLALEEG
jgi:multisubunit Na+/H+ antiporter MnhB subunit